MQLSVPGDGDGVLVDDLSEPMHDSLPGGCSTVFILRSASEVRDSVIRTGSNFRRGGAVHPDLITYLDKAGFTAGRARRVTAGLRVLQDLAARGAQPITYGVFAERLQPGLAPIATASILEDIGVFCNAAGWPNVTCFVVSAATGECSEGFTKISTEDPVAARDSAWFSYAVYKNAPTVDDCAQA